AIARASSRASLASRRLVGLALSVIAAWLVPTVSTATTSADSLAGPRATCVDFRSGESFTIGTQHLLADGALAVQWDPAGAHLCVGAAEEVSCASVPDGAGGAIVVWVDT